MNEELMQDKIKTHDTRLNNHAGRIDKLEQNQASVNRKMIKIME